MLLISQIEKTLLIPGKSDECLLANAMQCVNKFVNNKEKTPHFIMVSVLFVM